MIRTDAADGKPPLR